MSAIVQYMATELGERWKIRVEVVAFNLVVAGDSHPPIAQLLSELARVAAGEPKAPEQLRRIAQSPVRVESAVAQTRKDVDLEHLVNAVVAAELQQEQRPLEVQVTLKRPAIIERILDVQC